MNSVFDASALLAYLHDEPGSEIVYEALNAGALISAVNVAEVVSKVADWGYSPTAAEELLEASGVGAEVLGVSSFTLEDARIVSRLRPLTRARGLSVGDRACLALGLRSGLPVLTADRLWAGLAVGVEVRLIR